MRKDTLAALIALFFLAPFCLSILAGYWIDYEQDCVVDADCRRNGGNETCVGTMCQTSQRCGRGLDDTFEIGEGSGSSRNGLSQQGCPVGTRCNHRTGYCARPSRRLSNLIVLHPGYYPYRARVRRYRSMTRTTGVRGRYGSAGRRRGRYRRVGRYRSTGRSFRGGGLGFGK
jgi:hypothetical protein